MSPRYRRNRSNYVDLNVQEATPESLRIEIDNIFKDFLANPDANEYIFTSNLNNLQRKYIHEKAKDLNLQSKSYGKEPNRQLHIKKKRQSVNLQSFCIETCSQTNIALNSLFQMKFNHVHPPRARTKVKYSEKVFSNLINSVPSEVQPCQPAPSMVHFKENLPIFQMRNEILKTIANHQIVIVSSETGSGKTTQIPQYILEEMCLKRKQCKIICTQPRRISTVGVAERVAEERRDIVGRSVGYHIRLEQKYGPQTNLIYCTIGVMLRILMNGLEALKNITHLIIDEIHERDRLSDFLLICLKKALPNYPQLRVILMSATVNIQKFRDYFNNVAVLSIPGRLYPIEEYYLDDILHRFAYITPAMRRLMCKKNTQTAVEKLDNIINVHMDLALDDYMESGSDLLRAVSQLQVYFLTEDTSVNYQHSVTGMTALMIASCLGDVKTIGELCNMGADLTVRCNNGKTCFNYANENEQYEALQLLSYIKDNTPNKIENDSQHDDLLTLYDKTHTDEAIDFELIVDIIYKIQDSKEPGAILVFLPGYDDIMICNDCIVDSILDPNSYKTYFLHGSMSIRDQFDVFKPLKNCRKIILSTNIAETSITIDDVVFVIDCGKAKEKTYDSYNRLSSLETLWISKACAKQRAGRAGRTMPGKCYHLYSRQRYEHFDDERVPEILRTSLDELCLHTKILAPNNMNIHEFLSYAPDPPSANAIKASIENLESLGAIDDDEQLTPLGEYLAQLSIDPRLGKMLIYSVIFKCLDPILTLVAVSAHKDPFQLPPQANLRTMAAEKRKALTDGVLSDHLILLRAFDQWQNESEKGYAQQFCREYFISQSTMDIILETRRQLLSQLRAAEFVPPSAALGQFNTYAKSWPLIKAIIASGLYPLVAYPMGNYLCTRNEKKVYIANTSVLNKVQITSWLVYDELVKNKQNFYIKSITAVTPFTIATIAGNNVSVPSANNLVLDDWLDFEVINEQLIKFRLCINDLITKILSNPSYTYVYNDEFDYELLKVLNFTLKSEDEAANFLQINNVGNRPRFFFKRFESQTHTKQPNRINNGNNHINWRTENHLCDQFKRNVRFNNGNIRHMTNGNTLNNFNNNNGRFEYRDNPIYVLIKPRTIQNIVIAFNSSKWVLAPHTEKKIINFAEQGKVVFLVFCVDASGCINGIAQYKKLFHEPNCKPTALIEWKHKASVPFGTVTHLKNPYNNNKSIFSGLDGQVIEQNVAQELVRIYSEIQETIPSTSYERH